MGEQPEDTTEDAPETASPEAATEPTDVAPQGGAEAPATEAPAAQPPAEPEEQLSPKERRHRARSPHTQSRPQRSATERAAERLEARKKKAAERRRWRASSRDKRRAGGPREDTTPAPDTATTGRPRMRQGVVVSNRGDKTITVRIEVQRAHRTYGKVVRTSSTLHVHDEANDANAGDKVRVVESRPLSATKRWRLVEILERAR